jgi:F-type H+-transporting ATPase subunit delta
MIGAKQIRREAKQLFRLCFVKGLLDERRVRQVVQNVLAAKRRGGMALLSHFERLVRLEISRHRAEVGSATPLPADLQAKVLSNLESAYGPGISTTFAHVPALIGGMRIKVGSDVYDGSVRASLDMLQKNF